MAFFLILRVKNQIKLEKRALKNYCVYIQYRLLALTLRKPIRVGYTLHRYGYLGTWNVLKKR